MRKKSISRGILLVAGLIAVCAILLSSGVSHVKIQKSAEKETVIVQAPTEAIPGTAIKIDEPAIPFVTQIDEPEKKEFFPEITPKQATKYFKILLRTLIAPNAP